MLTGKCCVCLGLCVACLFLGGCRAAEEAVSDPGAQTDGQAQSVESLSLIHIFLFSLPTKFVLTFCALSGHAFAQNRGRIFG